jgi:hypothetical protein
MHSPAPKKPNAPLKCVSRNNCRFIATEAPQIKLRGFFYLCPSEIRRVDRIWKTISFSQGRANKKIVLRHGCLRRIVRQDCEKDSRWLPAGKKGRVTSK